MRKLFFAALAIVTLGLFGLNAADISAKDLKQPKLELAFMIDIEVEKPLVVGKDDEHGLRRLIYIKGGKVSGKLNGEVLPYGVDSQVVRPDGLTELTARYAIKLDDGAQIYIDNSGMRHITDPEVAKEAAQGKIVDPKYVYFATVTKFETYDAKYKWMERAIFVCYAVRLPDKVLLNFYEVK
ncbi:MULTISPECIES: DUF3237 domain-containing protein [Campylobacter]|uniref:DUF3237 domain-containing protein n=1 Tax=Campylobacter TaxID=194 RepID=UPI00147304BC|nr:DUF3237 domain-containing protein [Campylobacter sp. RM12916]MBE3021399.1 DUF3237 domain-containing protein [Campylobacter sp. 7477a]MBE3609279.1 DUF3237 domain-containing protein [Campylobacter sp. RM12916]